jgi:HPt (histidine-containing phosphotransfer) domain-containing protein
MLEDKLASTLVALRQKYVSTLHDRQSQLAAQVLELCDNGFTAEGLSNLFYQVHNIVGVAPTYGLPKLGKLAADAELLLSDIRDEDVISSEQEDDLIVAMEELVMEMGRICGDQAA